MEQEELTENCVHYLLSEEIPGFKDLPKDKQWDVVSRLVESKKSLSNIIDDGLKLIGTNKEQVLSEAKKIIVNLENEGVPITGIIFQALNGLQKGLKFIEEEMTKNKN